MKESKLQKDIITYLEVRNWMAEPTTMNQYQSGFPDVYCFHTKYGPRWVEVKKAKGYTFTKAQKFKFPKWHKVGVGIWILCDDTEEEYDKLFQPPNWLDYWKKSWGDPFNQPTVESILRDAYENDN